MSGIEERFQLKYPFSSEVSVILRCLTLMSGTNRFRNISKPQRRIISKIDFQGIDSLYSRQGTFSVRCAGVQNCVLFFFLYFLLLFGYVISLTNAVIYALIHSLKRKPDANLQNKSPVWSVEGPKNLTVSLLQRHIEFH